MKKNVLLKWMAFTFLLGLASCSNEELQNEVRPDVPLKSGEQLVSMKINGLGGTVATRAADTNITLPGEVKIDKLDLYSFVDLDNQSTSVAITGTTESDLNGYTLERVYHYEALGNTNDLVLTPVGDGYQASFGVPKSDSRIRIFVLVANDITRTTSKLTAVTVASADAGSDRSTASTLSGLKALKILETALAASGANITTDKGLPMTATIGRNEYGSDGTQAFNTLYTNADVAEGTALNATLVRRVARIDVKNSVATGFTVKKVTLSGAGNSTLFGDAPKATNSGDYDIVALAAKDLVSAELIPAALYAYPVEKDDANSYFPKVKVTGSVGGSGDIDVEAKFNGDMTDTFKGMNVNTRYIVNLYNSAGNITADITIADWDYGQSVDTEDVSGKLNSGASLSAETGNATLDTKTLSITYPSGTFSEAKIATIEGAASTNINPIGIVLPEDCDWLAVESGNAGSLGTTNISYNLKVTKANVTGRPRTAKLSLVTYNSTTSKQVVSEYLVYQDYLDITKYTESFDNTFYPFAATLFSTPDAVTWKCSPFGIDAAFAYGGVAGGTTTAIDVVIPEDCDWIQKASLNVTSSDKYLVLSMTDNIGKEERRATLTLRRWNFSGGGSSGAMKTKDVTIIQSGTVDKTMLCQSAEIQLNADLAAAGAIKMDGSTIIVAGTLPTVPALTEEQSEYMFTVKGTPAADKGEVRPVLVSFGEGDNRWVESEGKLGLVTVNGSYDVKARFPQNAGAAREMNFTVTTYANGAPVVKTYRLIQKASSETSVN